MRYLTVTILLLLSSASFAVPVTWTLQDVYLEYSDGPSYGPQGFDEQLQVIGSFVYDADAPYDWCPSYWCDLDDPDDYLQATAYKEFDISIINSEGETVYRLASPGAEIGYYLDPRVLTPTPITSSIEGKFICNYNKPGCLGEGAPEALFSPPFSTSDPSFHYLSELYLSFYGKELTNQGGVIDLTGEGYMDSFFRVAESPLLRPFGYGDYTYALTSGYITTVPVPAAVWLFGSALAALGFKRRLGLNAS